MAVSIEKNHLYLISEFVDGSNLEELLFGEDIKNPMLNNKAYIAKQITQAVAYLHNLDPLSCTVTLNLLTYWWLKSHVLPSFATCD